MRRKKKTTKASGSNTALDLRARPKSFNDVIGQDAAVRSFKSALREGKRSFLFSGSSGVGKTTLCRIAARECGIELIEVDAASNNGIDHVRELCRMVSTRSFTHEARGVLMDECHALSTQAWQALLKIVEEPPQGVYFFFCTTLLQKVPRAIQTRCASYQLRDITASVLDKHLTATVKAQRIKGVDGKTTKRIAEAAQGSVRAALVMLEQLAGGDESDVDLILKTGGVEGSTEVIEFCRMLAKQPENPVQVLQYIKGMEGESAETVRMVVLNYFYKCIMGEKKSVTRLDWFYSVLESFSGEPFPPNEKMVPVIIATFDAMES